MTSGEINEIVPEENRAFRDLIQYSFFPDRGPVVEKPGPLEHLYESGYDTYGYFEDDELRFGILTATLDATLRGGETKIAVLRFGATRPERRRTGLLYRAMPALFEFLAERGVPFILSREFKFGMYERIGATHVCNWTRWKFSNRALLSAVDEPRGQFRRLDRDDWQSLDSVHRRYADQFSLSIDRTEGYWQSLLTSYRKRRHIAGWELDGELRGYVVYRFSDSSSNPGMKRIYETDMGFVDHEAFRHLLYFLGTHDSQAATTKIVRPHGRSTIDVVKERKHTVEGKMETGPIMRVTDLQAALTIPSYPDDVSESVTVRVNDDLLPANDGVYELSVRNGQASVTPTEDAPDVTMDASVVPQLLTGFRDVARLEQLCDLSVHDAEAERALAELFPERPSFVRDEI